jgi:hypothetical protein
MQVPGRNNYANAYISKSLVLQGFETKTKQFSGFLLKKCVFDVDYFLCPHSPGPRFRFPHPLYQIIIFAKIYWAISLEHLGAIDLSVYQKINLDMLKGC